jgi:NADPH:quinone reductase
MRALVLRTFGGPENLAVEEIPKPAVRSGTLLIRLAATSVNSIDIKIREGALTIAPPLPAVLGSDLAGTVETASASFPPARKFTDAPAG